MFKEFESSKIIESYNLLENKFLDFLKTVPSDAQNKKTWSPDLIDILIGSCNLLDSLFRMSAPANYRGIKRKEFTINTFCDLFSKELEPLISLVYISPPCLLFPYAGWTKSNIPSWWNNYNEIKHNRLKNMNLATTETTINSLCGLFEAISQNQNLQKTLIRYSWVDLAGYNLDIIVPSLDKKKLPETIHGGLNTFLVQTKLFATTLGPNYFPKEIRKIKPAFYHGGKNLINFLGRWIEEY